MQKRRWRWRKNKIRFTGILTNTLGCKIFFHHTYARQQSIWITFTAAAVAAVTIEQSRAGCCLARVVSPRCIYIVSIGENTKQPKTQSETILEIRAVAGSVGTCDVNVIPLTYTLDLLLFLSHFNTPPQAHCWMQGRRGNSNSSVIVGG